VARLALESEYDIGQKLISVKAIKVTALSGTPTIAAVIAIRDSSWCYEHRTDPQPGGIIDADEPLEAQRPIGFYTLPAALQAAWFWDGAVVFAGEVPRIYMGSQPCLLKGTTLPTTRCTPTFGARS
jgi:hypothetical protein